MTVTLELSPEVEQKLRAQAQERGVSLHTLLQEIVSRQAQGTPSPSVAHANKTLKLPALRLGATGSLHRCDLYDDAP